MMETVRCTQCGSTDVEIISQTHGVCRMCNTNIVIAEKNEKLSKLEDVPNEYSCFKIVPEHSEGDFIRSAWISIFNENCPKEVYNSEFPKVTKKEIQVISDLVEVNATYSANIGYQIGDRYSNNYRYEPFASEGRIRSVKYLLLKGEDFDEKRFINALFTANREKTFMNINPQPGEIEIADSESDWLLRVQKMGIKNEIEQKCPGDIQTNLNYSIKEITETNRILYVAEEYEAKLNFKGEEYNFSMYPFGDTEIGGNGDCITFLDENPVEQYAQEMRKRKTSRDSNAELESVIWKKTGFAYIISIAAMIISIAVSVLSISATCVTATYFIAILAFIATQIFTRIFKWKNESQINDNIRAERERIEEGTEEKIKLFKKNYREECFTLLNEKLKSLGLQPASRDEAYLNAEEEEDEEEW